MKFHNKFHNTIFMKFQANLEQILGKLQANLKEISYSILNKLHNKTSRGFQQIKQTWDVLCAL